MAACAWREKQQSSGDASLQKAARGDGRCPARTGDLLLVGREHLTLRASAASTFQPASASRSRTQTAPLIISRQAHTSAARARAGQPVLVGRHNPPPEIVPSACFAHHAARRYAQSIHRTRVFASVLPVDNRMTGMDEQQASRVLPTPLAEIAQCD